MQFAPTETYARRLDEKDDLTHFRTLISSRPGYIALDGSVPGGFCKAAEDAMFRTVTDWRHAETGGAGSLNELRRSITANLWQDLASMAGTEPREVGLSPNADAALDRLLWTLYRPQGSRRQILVDEFCDQSLRGVLTAHLSRRGIDPIEAIVEAPSRDGRIVDEGDIVMSMAPDVQMAVLPAVVPASSQLLDMAFIAEQARDMQIVVGFDLSLSMGLMPHKLSDWDVDFAFWGNDRYTCGGPDAPAGLFLSKRFLPAPAATLPDEASQCVETEVTSLPTEPNASDFLGLKDVFLPASAWLQGATAMVAEAGIDRIRAKSLALTNYLINLIDWELGPYGFTMSNPREDDYRGGHVALVHPEAYRIANALAQGGVLATFVAPDILGFAPQPLFTSFFDCYDAIARLKPILVHRLYERYPL